MIAAVYHIDMLQAVVIGLIQGIFELFPLSSLGHTVLIPSWIGGSWATLVHQESRPESPYLAFVVGLHLANAVALLVFYAREWARIIGAFVTSLVRRRIERDVERLAWLIVVATIPVGALGLAFEHEFRVLFAKPVAAAVFLVANGGILLAGEYHLRRRPARGGVATEPGPGGGDRGRQAATGLAGFRDAHLTTIDAEVERRLAGLGFLSAAVIGAAQALALLAGISREGVALVGGLFRGLTREDGLRFAFLLSTPVILAAGALKVPDLLGPLGHDIRGEVVAGSTVAVLASLAAITLVARWLTTRTLVPFAVYSLLFGLASLVRFGLF